MVLFILTGMCEALTRHTVNHRDKQTTALTEETIVSLSAGLMFNSGKCCSRGLRGTNRAGSRPDKSDWARHRVEVKLTQTDWSFYLYLKEVEIHRHTKTAKRGSESVIQRWSRCEKCGRAVSFKIIKLHRSGWGVAYMSVSHYSNLLGSVRAKIQDFGDPGRNSEWIVPLGKC